MPKRKRNLAEERRRIARRAAIAGAVIRTEKGRVDPRGLNAMIQVVRSRNEATALRKSMGHVPETADGRVLNLLTRDDARKDLPKLQARKNTRRYMRFGVHQTAAGIIHDPTVAFSYWVRAKLYPDRDRMAGPCRIIDPVTGAVLHTLDPITRREIPS